MIVGGPRTSPEQAAAELASAGALPLVHYPGTVQAPWPALCLRCTREIAPRLATVRAGHDPCHQCALRRAHARRADQSGTSNNGNGGAETFAD